MYQDLSYMRIPLPEDVLKLKCYGDYDGALKTIKRYFEKEIPMALRKRLEIEEEIIRVMGVKEYPHSYEQALEIMRANIKDFKDEELAYLREIGAADWTYINGEVHFQERFYANLLKTRPEYAARALVEDEEEKIFSEIKGDILDGNVAYMKEHGRRAVRTQIRETIKPLKDAEEVGKKVRVHLPLPKVYQQVKKVEIIASSPEITYIAPEDADQRTVYFETELQEDQEFMVEYAFEYDIDYVELDPAKATKEQPTFCLEEQAPHIMFTPYLKEIVKEVKGDETNPIVVARRLYDFVTTKIKYSYVREYFTIDCIPEYCAVNQKGDCGVQALLFITLCRIAGIPAKWQSGHFVTTHYTGPHDWAQFYVAPYGWVYADCSFGGSAWREGNYDRWNYYFGNLDIYRMPSCSEVVKEFDPPKKWLRGDPVDNQRGEFEYEDHGLLYSQLDVKQELISMEDIEL